MITLMCSEQDHLNHLGHDVRHFLAGQGNAEPGTGLPERLMQRREGDDPQRTVDPQAPRVGHPLRA